MPIVREASSFVPDIGTTDTSDKQRSTECSLYVTRAKNRSGLLNLCRAFFVLFALKKDMEKDLKNTTNSKY